MARSYLFLGALFISLAFVSLARGAGAFPEFVDPHPGNDLGRFGSHVVPLATGNVVITAPGDDKGANNAGAVHLYNGQTGALISTIIGSHVNDEVGSGGVVALPNGNFVIISPNWGNGTLTRLGAVTWADGNTGISGTVSAANSLVGSREWDQVGGLGVKVVGDSNYVVSSRDVDGLVVDAGAVTWGDGDTGVSGPVSLENSLMGTRYRETVGGFSGYGVRVLPNGNYLVFTPNEIGGAVTWASGNTGVKGGVTPENSLVGNGKFSAVASSGDGVVVLANGDYVVTSPGWDRSEEMPDAGAVTWGSAETGVVGDVGPAISLVGNRAGQGVGSSVAGIGVVALPNGHYLVKTPLENAITWCNGATGRRGEFSVANSLVGYSGDLTVLPSGNYVISNPDASYSAWFDGSREESGSFDWSRCLVGLEWGDRVGTRVTVLTNGNYVVSGSGRGSTTWASGTQGVRGVVNEQNSLIGSMGNFGQVTPLANGNYVVTTTGYGSTSELLSQGAVTWCDGTTGRTGMISPANSLLGSAGEEYIGSSGVLALPDGHYVVLSSEWKNAAGAKVGAATWCRGDEETTGIVSPENSLIGSSQGDSSGMYAMSLPNSSYLVVRPSWRQEAGGLSCGAVTWCMAGISTTAAISEENSLIGRPGQVLGSLPYPGGTPPIQVLEDGDYVVRSRSGAIEDSPSRGSVTWGSAEGGLVGMISSWNSMLGPESGSVLGEYPVVPLPGGGFLAYTEVWAGFVAWAGGEGPDPGILSHENCLMSPPGTSSGMVPVVDVINGAYYGAAKDEGNGKVRVGSLTSGGQSLAKIKMELLPDQALPTSREAVDFGTTRPGLPVTKTFRVSNLGSWPLALGSITVGPADPVSFSVKTTGMSSSVISGKPTTFTVTFDPAVGGVVSHFLHIPTNDESAGVFQVALTGISNRVPVFAGYKTSGWSVTPLVIPVSRVLTAATDPDGGPVSLLGAGPFSTLGGTVVLTGGNLIYTGPSYGGVQDTFSVKIGDSLGGTSLGTVTVNITWPDGEEGDSTTQVSLLSGGKIGVRLPALPNQVRKIEVSNDLKSWRPFATLAADPYGVLRFVDEQPPAGRGFYRLNP